MELQEGILYPNIDEERNNALRVKMQLHSGGRFLNNVGLWFIVGSEEIPNQPEKDRMIVRCEEIGSPLEYVTTCDYSIMEDNGIEINKCEMKVIGASESDYIQIYLISDYYKNGEEYINLGWISRGIILTGVGEVEERKIGDDLLSCVFLAKTLKIRIEYHSLDANQKKVFVSYNCYI